MFFAEQEILKIFSFPLLRGDPNTALEAPFTVIIDESLAWKYFGDENPIGKTIRMALHRTYEFQVTGIIRNMPSNTILRTSMIASFATLHKIHGQAITQWDSWSMITTFVRLQKGADPAAVDAKITAVARAHLNKNERDASYYLQPLRRIYLENAAQGMNNDLDNTGSITRWIVEESTSNVFDNLDLSSEFFYP